MIEDVWYGDDWRSAGARALLSPLSAVFGAAVALRATLYDRRLLEVVDVGVPVVSVGGLSAGGSGKTPFVVWLAARLRRAGVQPCVLTRGYRGTAKQPLLLRPQDAPWSAGTIAAAGDEAVLVAARSGVPVVVAGDRAAGARLALQHLEPAVFVLDDGFQHRRLARDLDIVLVTGDERRQGLMPAGPLRERQAALGRAHVVVTTADSATDPSPASGSPALALSMRVRATAVVSSRAVLAAEPADASDAAEPGAGDVAGVGMLAGRRVAAVAAIARPQRFLATLKDLGASVVETMILRDHHAYDGRDWTRIAAMARGSDLVVTTEKDMVRLARFAAGTPWLVALRVQAEVDGEGALLERIDHILRLDRKGGSTHHPPTLRAANSMKTVRNA